MNEKAVLFDLDQTIVDSSPLVDLRQARKWQKVYERIPKCSLYDGIDQLLENLCELGIRTAIVTSSPRPYAHRVISHFQLNFDVLVAYHDTRDHKPNPAPIFLALERLDVSEGEAASIGDDPRDILASNRARVFSIAAMWGCTDPAANLRAKPDAIAYSVQQLRALLRTRFIMEI